MKDRREYFKKYQREWLRKKRAKWLKENGPCVTCGSNEKLEVDHIDPKTKTTHSFWSWSDLRRNEELKKCQVLCRACHKIKTKKDLSNFFKDRPNYSARKYSLEQVKQCMEDFYIHKIPARKIAINRKIPRGTVSAWIYDLSKISYAEIITSFRNA